MTSFFEPPPSTNTVAQDGLLQWANSIRHNMASDTGRQLFQQQVQTHGFLFLDDYISNILSGAKQDPLIELVKTPGRRKAIGKKPKLVSKLGNPIFFSLEATSDDNALQLKPPASLSPVQTQETIEPNFSSKATEDNTQKQLFLRQEKSERHDDRELVALPSSTFSTLSAAVPSKGISLGIPSGLEPANLSIIAEDDENLDSRGSAGSNGEDDIAQQVPAGETSIHHRTPSQSSESETKPRETSRRSTGLNSPSEYHSAQATPVSPNFPPQIAPPNMSKDVPAQVSVSTDTSTEKPLPDPPALQELDVVDMQVPLKDEDTTTKSNILSIPSLPEPAPFRKSIRALRDPSLSAAAMGTTTPGAGIGGKRTSWLVRAREVKALDATAKKANPTPPSTTSGMEPQLTVHLPTSSKRKSGDINQVQGSLSTWDAPERKAKATKNLESDVAPLKSQNESGHAPPDPIPNDQLSQRATLLPSPQGVLDRLKKTVEGLGARVGNVSSRTEEPGIATTFAEAKAAAQARIAERNHKEDDVMPSGLTVMAKTSVSEPANPIQSEGKMEVDAESPSNLSREAPRLSMSDLFPTGSRMKEKHKAPEKPFAFTPELLAARSISRESTSTTPPNSPPPPSNPPSVPSATVFNKPTPVFVPPAPSSSRPFPSSPPKEFTFQPPRTAFTVQPSLGLGLATSTSFGTFKPPPLTAQSTIESIRSESIFEKPDDVPAWLPGTQDTEYTSVYDTQSQQEQPMNICDEDDSWPVDEKLAAGVQWTFGGIMSKEDSMTWSTLPSQSQRADTGPLTKAGASTDQDSRGVEQPQETGIIPGAFDVEMDDEDVVSDKSDHDNRGLEEIVLSGGKSSQQSDAKSLRPQSQMSMASSSSSQSQGGFLNQASKLLSSALGTSKKKPEVKKVLQLAAVAAKKQQEEADKKAARLKEMETRRQAALQRKAEEEKAKQLEEERKMKEEMERRKREREETTDKRPLKSASSKKEEDLQKAKKPELEKKSILKKTASGTLGKSQSKPALKSAATFSSFTTPSQPSSSKPVVDASKLPKATPASSSKGKAKMAAGDDEVSQPSQLLQGQMAARAKAQMKAAKQKEPTIPSEAIELPDINSEYSDSEDEDRPRTFDPPDWAQSPELKQALELQSTINPDDIFGAVRPLRMEEIFRTRTSRFRARTSSANWTGTDMLTLEEEREYARRMGFK